VSGILAELDERGRHFEPDRLLPDQQLAPDGWRKNIKQLVGRLGHRH